MSRRLVREVMTRDVVSVSPDTPYRKIVDALVDRKISAVPVVDGDGRVAGVVSEADLLQKVEFIGPPQQRRVFAPRPRHAPRSTQPAAVAADLMTAPAVTVAPDAPVVAALKRMESEQVKRLPVVDGDGRLVGIVSRRDLLRMHLRPDPVIRGEIVDNVLRRTLRVDPVAVQVDVTDGVVTLSGMVDQRSTANLAVELATGVPGVAEVIDKLAWLRDPPTATSSSEIT